jgi:minimal PKS chain-length factor (CLF/KS beta)
VAPRSSTAKFAGYAATHDAFDPNRPAPDAQQTARAMTLAIADAGLTPDDIDVVIADAAGVPDLDALEAVALHMVFGERTGRVPVTAPQGFIGRPNAGGSAYQYMIRRSIDDGELGLLNGTSDQVSGGWGRRSSRTGP